MSAKGESYRRPDRFVFTTGEVARLLHVAQRLVLRWVDSGLLGGYVIPDSRDRRIPRDDLVRFLDRHGMPPLVELESWPAAASDLASYDRRILAREEAIRASGATACSYCGKPFSDHPGEARERRVCNGDLVRI